MTGAGPRQRKAAAVTARGGLPVRRAGLREPASYRAAADAQDGYVHTAFDGRSGIATASTDRIALDAMLAAAKRPRTVGSPMPQRVASSSTPRMCACSAGARSRPPKTRRSIRFRWSPGDQSNEDARARPRRRWRLRTMVVRPGVVYGRGERRSSASSSSRDERPRPRHRRRQQPLAARLRSRPGRSRTRAWRHAPMSAVFFTPTTKATSASTISSPPSRRISRSRPMSGMCPIDEARARRLVPSPTRWRSISAPAARAPGPSGGLPASSPSPATPRGCSRSGAHHGIRFAGNELLVISWASSAPPGSARGAPIPRCSRRRRSRAAPPRCYGEPEWLAIFAATV